MWPLFSEGRGTNANGHLILGYASSAVILQRALSLLRLLAGLCVLGSAACSRQPSSPPPPAAAPLPQMSGTLDLAGVSAPVRIVRDRWGVPHIYAQNERDLFFAQGFVQAQDRLFQMDLWRRRAGAIVGSARPIRRARRGDTPRAVSREMGTEWAMVLE